MVGNDFVGFNREGRHRDSPFSRQAQIGLYTAYLSFYIDFIASPHLLFACRYLAYPSSLDVAR